MLALFGELDNNIMAEKNRAAWGTGLEGRRAPDYTLRILPKANHYQVGSEGRKQRGDGLAAAVRTEYFTTIDDWLRSGSGIRPRAGAVTGPSSGAARSRAFLLEAILGPAAPAEIALPCSIIKEEW